MTTQTYNRVLVHIRRVIKNVAYPLNFAQSILDALECAQNTHICPMYVYLQDGKLFISDKPTEYSKQQVHMKRPSFCPLHNLSEEQEKSLPPEIRDRGVDVGAATLVESGDGKILLTRRAKHLRTFPGIWVPPGGHVEFNETLQEAGLRELHEETGLEISKDMCEGGDVPILALWESAFPPMLSMGLPKRHHAVVYIHAKLKSKYTAELMQSRLQLEPQEVGASAWIEKDLIKAIVRASEEDSNEDPIEVPNHLKTFRALVVHEDNTITEETLDTAPMLTRASGCEPGAERVSTGTKFVLSEWLNKTDGASSKM